MMIDTSSKPAFAFKTAAITEEDINEHKVFSTDMSGKPLRYKILVRDKVVQRVLYNLGNENVLELKF